ncbi:MAG: ferredoxin--NADP reductase [Candidatus Saccharimonadia bacterium]
MNKYIVSRTKIVGKNTLHLSLAPKTPEDRMRFYPGQYVALSYKVGLRTSPMRCFSILSSPKNAGELQFGIRIQGDFTRSLASLTIGETVLVQGPFGEFVIDESYDRSVILLAGGIGVTPFLSMIRHSTEAQRPTPITLLYSSQSQDDVPFYEELIELERLNPRFRVAFFITNGPVSKLTRGHVYSGRVDEDVFLQITKGHFNHFSYFICGPKGFMKGMKSILTSHRTDSNRIVSEEFSPSNQLIANIAPKDSASRWTYAISAASIVVGSAFVMFVDLARVVPKQLQADASQSAAITQSQSTPSTPTSSASSSVTTTPLSQAQTNTNSSSNSSASSSTQSSSAQSSQSTASSSTPTQTTTTQSTPTYYQQPVTSVS